LENYKSHGFQNDTIELLLLWSEGMMIASAHIVCGVL